MVTVKKTKEALAKVEEIAEVEEAWISDRGFLTLILRRYEHTDTDLFTIMHELRKHEFDGRIEINTTHLHSGVERKAMYAEHHDRTPDRI